MGDALAFLTESLGALDAASARRVRRSRVPDGLVNLSSNDYLGLGGSVAGLDDMPPAPWGAGASRLVTGDTAHHEDLERALADWLSCKDALVFSSGYAANVGVIGALMADGDLIVSDEKNHASIIDGCRLSRARVVVVPHLDAAAVELSLATIPHRRAMVVTESWFSMDADTPDLPRLRNVCDEYSAVLMVDEAHALGVFGPDGRGLCAGCGVVPDILIGTFGKALGGSGAFVAGPHLLLDWLWNRARSFVFSTGMSPQMAAVLARRVGLVRAANGARVRLAAMSARVRGSCPSGLSVLGHGPIVPVVLGTNDRALTASASLRARGFHVVAIRPPTVPENTARLRLTLRADCTDDDVERLVAALGGLA